MYTEAACREERSSSKGNLGALIFPWRILAEGNGSHPKLMGGLCGSVGVED